MTIHSTPCFCGSGHPFDECCEPVLNDHGKALTPLALMRSRYTAYVLQNEAFLLQTWSPSTRPEALGLCDHRVKWLELTIHSHSEEASANTGEVEFSARFIDQDQLCTLHETSRFIRQEGLWYYLDGTGETSREKLGRNSICPCGSGKKFKRCCLLKQKE